MTGRIRSNQRLARSQRFDRYSSGILIDMYVGGFGEELDELVERLRRALGEDKPIDVLLG